jgi:WD40 repeat protein
MAWPLSQDYNEAIQNPHLCFADDELRAGQGATNGLGIPMPRSGNFADVYEVRCPLTDSRWAVKCFTRPMPGLRERYAAISAHLRQAGLGFAVDFHYLEQGIRVRGQWFPVLKMEWVEGLLLNEFVRGSLDKPAVLESLAAIWARMARRLRKAQLAHGDLQHGNVILVPGRDPGALAVKLIDYDGMWVPALARTPSGEVGHPAYQHPQRLREGTYNAEVDRFPLLVSYVAIRALMVGGRALWERYDNGDNLLFREQDLRTPRESPLFRETVRLPDPEVRRLVDCLSRAVYKPLEQTPLLEELLPSPVPSPAGSARGSAASVQPAYPTAIPVEEPAQPAYSVAIPVPEPPPPRPGRLGAEKPTTGRGLLIGGLLAGAGTVLLCCLGFGTLNFMGSDAKPTTASPVAIGRTSPERAKDVPSAFAESHPTAPTEKAPTRESPPAEPKRAPKPVPLTLTGHIAGAYSVCWSPDGKRLATASGLKTAKVWDAATGHETLALQGHKDAVLSLCWSPDGKRLASGADGVKVWNAATGQETLTLKVPFGSIQSVCWSPDSKRLASGAVGVKVWDAATGQETIILQGRMDFYPLCMCWSPDGERLAAPSGEAVNVWDATSGQEVLTLNGHTGGVTSVCWSPDGKRLASAGSRFDDKGWKSEVKVWDAASGHETRTLQRSTDRAGQRHVVWGLCWSPDGKRLGGAGGVWDEQKGSYVAGEVKVWDATSGQEAFTLQGHTRPVTSACWSLDGKRLASAGSDEVKVWDAEKGE